MTDEQANDLPGPAIYRIEPPVLVMQAREAMRQDFMTWHGLKTTRKGEYPTNLCPFCVKRGHRCSYDYDRWGRPRCWPRTDLLDHCEAFARDSKQCVFVSQPYHYDRAVLRACCEAGDLAAFVYDPAWSWYYPNRTKLIAFVARENAPEFSEREAKRSARPWSVASVNAPAPKGFCTPRVYRTELNAADAQGIE